MEKTIKEIFKDYNSNSFALNAAKIKNINLFKKTNKLEIQIIAKEFIKISDLYLFEKYLKNRFNIQEIILKIEYENNIDVDIKQEWEDILDYMANKYPLVKALLKGSYIEQTNDKLKVNLALKGKDVLEARGFDKILSKLIEDIYGKKLKVQYSENITKEMLEKMQEEAYKNEREVIDKITQKRRRDKTKCGRAANASATI